MSKPKSESGAERPTRPRVSTRQTNDSEPLTATAARLAVLRWLGRRDYTRRELLAKLARKNCPIEVAEHTLAALEQSGVVNDARAAAAHVRTASRVKGRGPLRIRQELQARGVAKETITEATGGLSADASREVLLDVLRRKRITLPVPAEDRPRLFRQLIRRGFPSDLVSAVLRFTPDD